jgi:type VI secretion system secreted protein VgrG
MAVVAVRGRYDLSAEGALSLADTTWSEKSVVKVLPVMVTLPSLSIVSVESPTTIRNTAALGFGDLHRDGIGMAVVAVRGRYDLSAEGALSIDVVEHERLGVGEAERALGGEVVAAAHRDHRHPVTITGKTFTTDFSDQVKHWGKVIDLNPSR